MLVKMSHQYRTIQTLPIQYNIPLGKSFLATPPQQINVTFYGKGWDLLSNFFYTSKNFLLINLSESPEQSISRGELKDKIKRLTPSLQVEDLDQNGLQIVLEELTLKKVPVVLHHELAFEVPFQLKDSLLIQPDSVFIEGPSSLIDSVYEWHTIVLVKNDIKANFRTAVNLIPSSNPQLKLEAKAIVVDAVVEQFTKKSIFLSVQVKNAPDSLKRIYPEKVKLSCVVGLSRYQELSSENFELSVDLSDVTPNTGNNTAAISITKQPPYVQGINFSPKSVVFYFGETQ
ncbi:MAG: hypothetical protein AB8G15_21845 [Saprospiraceae bacterium]